MEYAFPGDYPTCKNEGINGILTDGGYAEYVTLDFTGITKIPKELDPAQAPLFCSGVTTFVSQYCSNARYGLKTLADAIESRNTELYEEHGSSARSCCRHPRSRWSWVSVSYRTAGELLSESEYLHFSAIWVSNSLPNPVLRLSPFRPPTRRRISLRNSVLTFTSTDRRRIRPRRSTSSAVPI
jgi:hypothetical protein